MALRSLNTYARDREHRVQQLPTDRFSSRENHRGDKPPEKRSDRGKKRMVLLPMRLFILSIIALILNFLLAFISEQMRTMSSGISLSPFSHCCQATTLSSRAIYLALSSTVIAKIWRIACSSNAFIIWSLHKRRWNSNNIAVDISA